MDKQNKIEEMYQEFLNYKFEKSCPETFSYKGLFEHFYNAGYRKIPENAVVLTRKEKLKEVNDLVKEKLKKFAERVKMAFYYEFDELIPSIMADKIDEIAKELEGENVD